MPVLACEAGMPVLACARGHLQPLAVVEHDLVGALFRLAVRAVHLLPDARQVVVGVAVALGERDGAAAVDPERRQRLLEGDVPQALALEHGAVEGRLGQRLDLRRGGRQR